MPLKVKLLDNLATPPTVAHAGEDLGYDIYAKIIPGQLRNEDGTPVPFAEPKAGMPYRIDTTTGKQVRPIRIESGRPTLVETGIAAHFVKDGQKFGLLVRDRSSIAKKGLFTVAGVIDEGYRGEIKIMFNLAAGSYLDLYPGDKIAQLIPVPVYTDTVEVVDDLDASAREEGGFGSTGQ